MRRALSDNVFLTSPQGQLPLTLEVLPMAHRAGYILAVILAFAGIGVASANDPPFNAVGYIAVLAGVVIGLRAWRAGRRKLSVRIDGETVQVTGSETWSEPLSAYRGVRWQRYAVRNRSNDSGRDRPRHVHVIDLAHEDDDRSVPLFRESTGRLGLVQIFAALRDSARVAASGDERDAATLEGRTDAILAGLKGNDPRGHWEGYARLFDLPAIDARDGAEEVRAAADLDKSLKDRAAEGQVEADLAPGDAPAELEITHEGEPDKPETHAIHIVLNAPSMPIWVFWAFGGAGALFFVQGLFTLSFGGIVFGLLFAGIGYGIYQLEMRNPRSIDITREEIAYTVPNVEQRGFTLALSEIESVTLRDTGSTPSANSSRTFSLGGKELLISTDAAEERLGGGLSEESLNWLRRYLVSAIAHA